MFPRFEKLEEMRESTDPMPEFTTDTPLMRKYEELERLVNGHMPQWYRYSLDLMNRTGRISPELIEMAKQYLRKRLRLEESEARLYDTGVPGVPTLGTPEEQALHYFALHTDELLEDFKSIGCFGDEMTLDMLKLTNDQGIVCHDVPFL